jgi:hypothetical protein
MAQDVPRYANPAISGVFTGTNGTDNFNGTVNDDTAQIDAGRHGTLVTTDGEGLVSTVGAAGLDTYNSIETLIFVDGRLTFNADDNAAVVNRLFEVALDRGADQAGLNTYVGYLEESSNPSDVADVLISSGEFASRFGTLDNTAFVTQIYENMRGAAPSPSEASGWVSLLNNEDMSRGELVVAFAQSAEAMEATQGTVMAGIWDRDEAAVEIARTYDVVFGRDADLGGMSFWVNQVHNNGLTLDDAAANFMQSQEAQAAYGSLNNADFVNAIYNNALDRDAEQQGALYWQAQLDGGMARSELILSFTESAEYQALTNDHFQSEDPSQYGVPLVNDGAIA